MAKKQAVTATAPVATPAVTAKVTVTEEQLNNGVVRDPIKKGSGTTESLFPDLVPQEAEKAPEPVQEEKKEEKKEEEVSSAKSSEPEEYYLEDFLEKNKIPLDKLKSRIKVDGKEEVISFDEFKKRVQLKEHITRATQDLGRLRREFAEERKRVQDNQQTRNFRQNPGESELAHAEPKIADKDYFIESLLNRIDSLETRLTPTIYEANRRNIDQQLKAEGFDDFLDYLPKMEVFISKLTDPNQQVYFDTEDGARNLYMQLKARDLMEERSKPKKEEAKVPVQERPAPPIVKMDSGQQPSTLSGTDIDDATAKYNELFNRWKQTRSDSDFREMLRLKGALGK